MQNLDCISTHSLRENARCSSPFRREGIPVRGASLKVYTPAKTVADCFKFRNKIGMDVALEALRECRRLKQASMDDLWAAAKVCRVANVMRPYLESL
jgi:hypothetical protein